MNGTDRESMRRMLNEFLQRLVRKVGLRVSIGVAVILFMANLDALTDAVLYTDVPYFGREHLIVGGVTATVTIVLFGMLSIYVAILKRATSEIKRLQGLLPICSACHKIRTPENDWHTLEKYISERSEAVFTHSLCPDCAKTLYPEMYAEPGGAGKATGNG
ncbi:MAG TPA: hypothetical protein VMM37_08110 [Bacteroidota bacterium]|nr:hypothetical protein [Bacteroidota bacterium]